MRILLTAFIVLISAVLFGTYLRSRYLLRVSRGLQEAAGRYPTDYLVGARPGVPLGLLVMGDSTAVGVGTSTVEETLGYRLAVRLERREGRPVRVTVRAVTGAVAADMAGQRPDGAFDVALIAVPANDATAGTDPAAAAASIRAALPDAPRIILSTTPAFRGTPALPAPLRPFITRRADRLASAVRGLAVDDRRISVWELNRDGDLPAAEYAADRFHPDASGYARWAALLPE